MPKGVRLPRVELPCARCGQVFSRVGSDTDRKHCSSACAYQSRRKHIVLPRPCQACGNMFLPKDRHTERAVKRRYCSQGCHLHQLALQQKREYGGWFYVKDAKRTLLNTIGRCERCGYSTEPGILEIHHIDRNRRFNHRSNLLLLCPLCHSLDHFHAHDGQFRNNLGRQPRS